MLTDTTFARSFEIDFSGFEMTMNQEGSYSTQPLLATAIDALALPATVH